MSPLADAIYAASSGDFLDMSKLALRFVIRVASLAYWRDPALESFCLWM